MDIQFDLDNYIRLGKIGHGSFSEVYKVKEKDTGRFFAAKILFKSLDDTDESNILDIRREINIISKLNHPSILKFIGFSPIDYHKENKPVIITEFVPNGTLQDIINSERNSLSSQLWDNTKKLINIFGIASAMSYLHSHNILHRDLKPANILMDEFLCPKIADFGLSKITDSKLDSFSFQSVGVKGTPAYTAPEIYDSLQYSKAGDVYSFAFIVYEIITNEKPFKDLTMLKMINKVANGERPEFTFPIPESYENLIKSCWDQDPEKRPTFDQILIELKNDQGFITDLVDKNDFFDYVDFIEQYKATFDETKRVTSIDRFIKRQTSTFKKVKIQEVNNETDENSLESGSIDKKDELESRKIIKSKFKKDTVLNLVLFGIGATGKTALVRQLINYYFLTDFDPTIEDTYEYKTNIDDIDIKTVIIDTGGSDDLSPMWPSSVRRGDGFMIVYCIDDRESFEKVENFIRMIYSVKKLDINMNNIPIVICENKIDLEDKRVVRKEEGEQLANKYKTHFVQTSALTKTNIQNSFENLIRYTMENYEDKDSKNDKNDKKKCIIN